MHEEQLRCREECDVEDEQNGVQQVRSQRRAEEDRENVEERSREREGQD